MTTPTDHITRAIADKQRTLYELTGEVIEQRAAIALKEQQIVNIYWQLEHLEHINTTGEAS